jgi:hypothetical protein
LALKRDTFVASVYPGLSALQTGKITAPQAPAATAGRRIQPCSQTNLTARRRNRRHFSVPFRSNQREHAMHGHDTVYHAFKVGFGVQAVPAASGDAVSPETALVRGRYLAPGGGG